MEFLGNQKSKTPYVVVEKNSFAFSDREIFFSFKGKITVQRYYGTPCTSKFLNTTRSFYVFFEI